MSRTISAQDCQEPALPGRDGVLTVGLCVITRNRLRMLEALLGSFRAMRTPEGVRPVFVIVENNGQQTLAEPVARFRDAVSPSPVVLGLEPELGIPIARNRACELALEQGADVLVFVDDDEQVAPDWLDRLIARYRSTDLMLIGGPVLVAFPPGESTAWQRRLQAGIAHRFRAKARKARAATEAGRQDRVTVVTNNWLADASLFTRHGLRFDPRLRFTGGSDTQFYRDARAAGLPTGWAPDAVVVETTSADRVSFRYQFRRAMEQSRTSFHHKIRSRGYARAVLSVLPVTLARLAGLAGLALALPFALGPTLIEIARSAGWLAGRVTGLLGARSSLYRDTTGF